MFATFDWQSLECLAPSASKHALEAKVGEISSSRKDAPV